MKTTYALFVLVCGALLTSGRAATKAGYQPATVVSVESRAIPSNYAGDNGFDAPFQPEAHCYDIGILVGGTVSEPVTIPLSMNCLQPSLPITRSRSI